MTTAIPSSAQDPAVEPSRAERPERPAGLAIVALILILAGGSLALAAAGYQIPLVQGGLYALVGSPEGKIAVWVIVGLCLIAAVAMLLGWRWGWALAIILVGVALASNLISYAQGDFNLIRLALFVAAAFYLNQTSVREYFAGRPRDPESLGR